MGTIPNSIMSYYTTFISKPLKLKKDTPVKIIELLDRCINTKEGQLPEFQELEKMHDFFLTKRWKTLLYSIQELKEGETSFTKKGNHYFLQIACDINYEDGEIDRFCDWIYPYIVGHKPKEYIGYRQGEDEDRRRNIYLSRVLQHKPVPSLALQEKSKA